MAKLRICSIIRIMDHAGQIGSKWIYFSESIATGRLSKASCGLWLRIGPGTVDLKVSSGVAR